jgi:hypothetical protein
VLQFFLEMLWWIKIRIKTHKSKLLMQIFPAFQSDIRIRNSQFQLVFTHSVKIDVKNGRL